MKNRIRAWGLIASLSLLPIGFLLIFLVKLPISESKVHPAIRVQERVYATIIGKHGAAIFVLECLTSEGDEITYTMNASGRETLAVNGKPILRFEEEFPHTGRRIAQILRTNYPGIASDPALAKISKDPILQIRAQLKEWLHTIAPFI